MSSPSPCRFSSIAKPIISVLRGRHHYRPVMDQFPLARTGKNIRHGFQLGLRKSYRPSAAQSIPDSHPASSCVLCGRQVRNVSANTINTIDRDTVPTYLIFQCRSSSISHGGKGEGPLAWSAHCNHATRQSRQGVRPSCISDDKHLSTSTHLSPAIMVGTLPHVPDKVDV